jgi:spore germination protein GerM
MADNKKILAAVLSGVLVILVVVFLITSGRERIRKAGTSAPSATASVPSDGRPTKKATLFFPRDDDGLLVAEDRDIPAGASVERDAVTVLTELIKGPSGGLVAAFPPETKVDGLFITKDGTAYVDFSSDLADKHPSGTDAETSTVFSVVNTLAFNFTNIKKVYILIDGRERETLAGHLSLERAILPDYSLNANR